MTIRLATKDDYFALMSLYNLFVGSDRYSGHDNDSFQKVILNKNNFVYIALKEDKQIGFISFSIRDVVRYSKPIAELDELFVLKEYRKAGIGKLLMEEFEKKVREVDCHRIFIESHYDHIPAHKFYERLGYSNYGYHFIKTL